MFCLLHTDVLWCRTPRVKVASEDSTKEKLLEAAEVSDTPVDPINFKPVNGNLKHSPNTAARKEAVWSHLVKLHKQVLEPVFLFWIAMT